ncbi:MAG: hypothetical protein OXT74_00080 [Candidatus Poribacteria bacterium]|nr:hypothetical protein [Candidatus Poribacteria bacterium]
MLINQCFKSNSPQNSLRVGLFLLVTSRWPLATAFIAILLSAGCADETINNPIAEKPVEDSELDGTVSISTNYFPMTVGSRWVYRNPDGSEWTREVTETEEVGTRHYHHFSNDPPMEDNQFPFFRAPMYIATLNSVVLKVKNSDINDAIRQIVLESNDNLSGWTWVQKFQNGVWKTRKKGLAFLNNYNATGVLRNDSGFLLRLPLVPGQTWEMLTIRLSGSSEMAFLHHSFESDVEILGTVGEPYSVPTPAGIFEDCLNIQYQAMPPSVRTSEFTDQAEAPENVKIKRRKHMEAELRKELTTLLTHMMPKLGLESMWLAPGVGPVEIKSAEGTAVLIDYDIKAVAPYRTR